MILGDKRPPQGGNPKARGKRSATPGNQVSEKTRALHGHNLDLVIVEI